MGRASERSAPPKQKGAVKMNLFLTQKKKLGFFGKLFYGKEFLIYEFKCFIR